MAKQKDVFGFEELTKAFENIKDKYDNEADARLYSLAKQANKRLRQLVDVKTGEVKRSYRGKKTKNFGEAKVARVENIARHGHLYELGHEIYTVSGRRKVGKVAQYNAFGRAVKGVRKHGRVEGKYLFDKVFKELKGKLREEGQEILEKITKDLVI